MVNQHLVRDLQQLGLWNHDMKNKIIAHNGSVQHIPEIPPEIRQLYKTIWEISQKRQVDSHRKREREITVCLMIRLLDMAADRGAFIDQSQSLNVYIASPNVGKLSSMHFHGWKKGLKTGMYYLRTRPAAEAIKFTIDQHYLSSAKGAVGKEEDMTRNPQGPSKEELLSCSLQNPEGCLSCSG